MTHFYRKLTGLILVMLALYVSIILSQTTDSYIVGEKTIIKSHQNSTDSLADSKHQFSIDALEGTVSAQQVLIENQIIMIEKVLTRLSYLENEMVENRLSISSKIILD